MKTRSLSLIFAVSFFIATTAVASAHPGRTDSYGCHTCRTNCPSWGLPRGEYHCHKAKALPQAIEPIKSKRGDSGTGFTVPAPEYKNSVTVPQSDNKAKVGENKKEAGWLKKLIKSFGL